MEVLLVPISKHSPRSELVPESGTNQQLVTDEPVKFEDNLWKFETLGELLTILEESIECTSNEWKHQNQKMSTCNRLDLKSLGSCRTMPRNFPGTGWYHFMCVLLISNQSCARLWYLQPSSLNRSFITLDNLWTGNRQQVTDEPADVQDFRKTTHHFRGI